MTGVEPAIIGAIANLAAPVLPIAIKGIQGALKKRQVRDSDVETLKSQLSYIQGIIRDTRKTIRSSQDPSDRLQSWAGYLRCLAYDIEDLIEGRRAGTMTGAKLNGKITIIQDLIRCVESYPEFMAVPTNDAPSQGAASSSTTSSAQLVVPSNPQTAGRGFPLADLVGKKEDLDELLDLLVRRPDNELDKVLKVMVISVVGFGGIGETKLCHTVYTSVQESRKFSLHAYVSAAGKDCSIVLQEIIEQFRLQEDPQDSSGGFFHRFAGAFPGARRTDQVHGLPEYLQRKRYFVVVDGVESEELVSGIASAFPDNSMGSRIIMGMRTAVGRDAERCVGHRHKMWPLEDKQSVVCFLNEAERRRRRRRHEQDDHSSFIRFQEQDHSSSCLHKVCDGVPLALVSVCEVRRGSIITAAVEEQDRWPHRMPKVLDHSYDGLHIRGAGSCPNQYIPYLQACLLYFAMFPRGNHVKRGSLIRRWQAEGLEFGGSNQAAENLKALVDRNFVWPLHASLNEHAKTFQPPGVVLNYISRRSQEEEFILRSCPSGDLNPNYSRRLCLHPAEEEEGEPQPSVITNGSVPPRLRTLAVSWGHQQASRIAECEQLRVLDLASYNGLQPDQLEEICKKLKLLKYLSLLPDIITQVPSSMSNLQCLETLELGEVNGRAAVLVPIQVLELPCIKHLIGKFELIDNFYGLPIRAYPDALVPKAIKESNLETVSGFFTHRGQGFPPLMRHMRQLRKVKIWFYKDAEPKYLASYLPKAITKFLRNANVPPSLSLDFQDGPRQTEILQACVAEASGNLYSLKLSSGTNLSRIQLSVIATNKLTGITKLCLSRWKTITLDAEFLNELSRLVHLRYLKLDAETIKGTYDQNPTPGGNNQEKVVIETGHIANLRRMWLVARQTLPDIQVKPTALQRLVSLHLISETDDYCPSANVICKANPQDDNEPAPFTSLQEVSLNATVPENLRDSWRNAARDHPKRPRILFIQHPHRAG